MSKDFCVFADINLISQLHILSACVPEILKMDDLVLLEELVFILEKNGVRIRREAMGGNGGGLCVISAKQVCFVDTEAGTLNNAARCAEAVNNIIDIENIYVRPVVREFLAEHKCEI